MIFFLEVNKTPFQLCKSVKQRENNKIFFVFPSSRSQHRKGNRLTVAQYQERDSSARIKGEVGEREDVENLLRDIVHFWRQAPFVYYQKSVCQF